MNKPRTSKRQPGPVRRAATPPHGAPREAVGYLAYLDLKTLRETRPEAS